MHRAGIALVVSISALAWSLPGDGAPLSIRDSFRIGSDGSSLCSGQPLVNDPALTGMFDSGYSITCRDAALAVGKIYKLRSGGDPQARLGALRRKEVACQAPVPGSIDGLGEGHLI